MNRELAKTYVSFVVDDTGNGRKLNSDVCAVVREAGDKYKYASVLVGWQCGFEPLFVAVHSYLDVELSDDEVVDMATEYLLERNWFSDEPTEPDYIIR